MELAQLNYTSFRATEKRQFRQQTSGIGTWGPANGNWKSASGVSGLHRPPSAGDRERRTPARPSAENRRRTPSAVDRPVHPTRAKSTLLNANMVHEPGPGRLRRRPALRHADPTTPDPAAGGRVALLMDTVGFIQNLPHHLAVAFRATLEARDATSCRASSTRRDRQGPPTPRL